METEIDVRQGENKHARQWIKKHLPKGVTITTGDVWDHLERLFLAFDVTGLKKKELLRLQRKIMTPIHKEARRQDKQGYPKLLWPVFVL